jgi:hypothetical protein
MWAMLVCSTERAPLPKHLCGGLAHPKSKMKCRSAIRIQEMVN